MSALTLSALTLSTLLMPAFAPPAAAQAPVAEAPGAQTSSASGVRAQAADQALFGAMLSAEDRRPKTRAEMAPLLRGLDMANVPAVQVEAARGLGRLENPEIIPDLARLLESRVPAVRAEAVNAIGQAVKKADLQLALTPLLARAALEQDPMVRGVLARTIGRLAYASNVASRPAEDAILTLSWASSSEASANTRRDAEATTLFGVAHGLASIARTLKGAPLSTDAVARLRQLAQYGRSPAQASTAPSSTAPSSTAPSSRAAGAQSATAPNANAVSDINGDSRDLAARVRRLAVAALALSGDGVDPSFDATIGDPDPQVRRQTLVSAMPNNRLSTQAETLAASRLADPAVMVRYEALRTIGRLRARSRLAASRDYVPSGRTESCQAELAALTDASTHVALLAIDQLATCPRTPATIDALAKLVDARPARASGAATVATIGATAGDWHRAAHAIVSLAHLSPERAGERMTRVTKDPVWQVRTYAARAASVLKDRATLDTLAHDEQDNVRTAAVDALHTLVKHDADAVYLDQLTRHDYQLLRSAATALNGTPRAGDALTAMVAAFTRISADRSETSRDARLALLTSVTTAGAAAGRVTAAGLAPRPNPVADVARQLEPFLADFDPLVASAAANTLTAWGVPHAPAAPRPLPLAATPARQELNALSQTNAVIHMASGRAFTIALLPFEAPTNVARFARQAKSGHFTSLTFHRVEPNFVIQGGSPHANEYWGDPRFARDEVSLRSHTRGTIGISTRGRDTGDGQLFVNLVDNYRLDHDYTIIGVVIDGLDAVDAVLEGDAIARIELKAAPR